MTRAALFAVWLMFLAFLFAAGAIITICAVIYLESSMYGHAALCAVGTLLLADRFVRTMAERP